MADSLEQFESKVIGIGLVASQEVGSNDPVSRTVKEQRWDAQALALPSTQENTRELPRDEQPVEPLRGVCASRFTQQREVRLPLGRIPGHAARVRPAHNRAHEPSPTHE